MQEERGSKVKVTCLTLDLPLLLEMLMTDDFLLLKILTIYKRWG